mmetsp:Transcript_10333/g.29011  ORF Transcript_10333/g.29011 Transcript_10333/m.29011 type:complete len:230 (+) Transcript_10333:498-1187(+)
MDPISGALPETEVHLQAGAVAGAGGEVHVAPGVGGRRRRHGQSCARAAGHHAQDAARGVPLEEGHSGDHPVPGGRGHARAGADGADFCALDGCAPQGAAGRRGDPRGEGLRGEVDFQKVLRHRGRDARRHFWGRCRGSEAPATAQHVAGSCSAAAAGSGHVRGFLAGRRAASLHGRGEAMRWGEEAMQETDRAGTAGRAPGAGGCSSSKQQHQGGGAPAGPRPQRDGLG